MDARPELGAPALMALGRAVLRATDDDGNNTAAAPGAGAGEGGGGGGGGTSEGAVATTAMRDSLKFTKLVLGILQKLAAPIRALPAGGGSGGGGRGELLDTLQAALERCTTFLAKPALAQVKRLRT